MASLYLDENIGSTLLIELLQQAHHRVVFSRAIGNRNVSDDYHLYAATMRDEILISHDSDFFGIHGALHRMASDHGIAVMHAGILLVPQNRLTEHDIARYVDAFFAAALPIANRLYEYRAQGSWVQYHPRPYP